MSKRKKYPKRGLAFGDRSKKIREFVSSYQYSLRALIASLPEQYDMVAPQDIATVGFSEIWPCRDGTVVLIYQSDDIKVTVKDRLKKTIQEFLLGSEAMAFYDEQGNRAPISAGVYVENASKMIIDFAGLEIRAGGREYRPRFRRGIVLGREAQLPKPDEKALDDFRTVFVTRNVAGPEAIGLPLSEGQKLTEKKASKIINEFNSLLNAAEKEEELQHFLAEHPELLYPDFIECFPKFKLGDDFVTDYVFLVQSHEGPEYVFVEIERANKEIFIKQGQFSASFTQAKDQILNWDKWITQNHAYIAKKLPGLFKPKFHLIMGRSEGLTNEQREKLKTEFAATSRGFSTYSDLADRFQQIIARIT